MLKRREPKAKGNGESGRKRRLGKRSRPRRRRPQARVLRGCISPQRRPPLWVSEGSVSADCTAKKITGAVEEPLLLTESSEKRALSRIRRQISSNQVKSSRSKLRAASSEQRAPSRELRAASSEQRAPSSELRAASYKSGRSEKRHLSRARRALSGGLL